MTRRAVGARDLSDQFQAKAAGLASAAKERAKERIIPKLSARFGNKESLGIQFVLARHRSMHAKINAIDRWCRTNALDELTSDSLPSFSGQGSTGSDEAGTVSWHNFNVRQLIENA